MSLQNAMIRESIESMSVLAHLAHQGKEEEQQALKAMDLPDHGERLAGFLYGLKFVADIIKATSKEPTAVKLSW
jgi:hypothetical protein